jgi:FAD:protein FMN transferase
MRRTLFAAAFALAACREVPRPERPETAVSVLAVASVAAEPVASAVPSAVGSATPPVFEPKRVDVEGKAMGTHIAMTVYTDPTHDVPAAQAAMKAAFDEIVRLEGLMSPYQADSELSQVNAAAGKQPVAVGPEMLEVMDKSLWISERSGGVFDVTFASMGKLWRFNHDMVREVPDAKLVAAARKRIDYRHVKVDHDKHTLFLERADQKIDYGGIAKGYAVDRAARILREAGLASFYVQAGGDLYVEGKKPDGQPMRVGVRDPRGPEGSFFARLPVENHAFSTAGDYERYFVKDGKRYHHVIDPRTGFPATASRSVTLWARDAFTADAIDDAVFILGPEKGLEIVEAIDDCGAVIVDANNKVWISKRLQGVVEILREPTDGP